jgi:hypothetical protein
MAKKAGAQRGKVDTSFDYPPKTITSPRDGYGLPPRLEAVFKDDAELPGVVVTVQIEVEVGRARATKVCVETESPGGIGWTTLASVRTRDIVATAVLTALGRLVPGDEEGTYRYVLLPDADYDEDEVREIVRSSVGYTPNMDRYEREAVLA